MNEATNRVYVVNYGSSDLTVIDDAANRPIATIPVGLWPQQIAINARTNTVYVVNTHADSVSVIDGKTNRVRRVLNQAANAAVKAKGTIVSVVYRRIVPRLGHAQAIGAITHRLCRLIWKILRERVRYEERGPAVSVEAKKVRARKMIRELRGLGYRVELISPAPSA